MMKLKEYRTYFTDDCSHHVIVKHINKTRTYATISIDNNPRKAVLPIYQNHNEIECLLPTYPNGDKSVLFIDKLVIKANRYFA